MLVRSRLVTVPITAIVVNTPAVATSASATDSDA